MFSGNHPQQILRVGRSISSMKAGNIILLWKTLEAMVDGITCSKCLVSEKFTSMKSHSSLSLRGSTIHPKFSYYVLLAVSRTGFMVFHLHVSHPWMSFNSLWWIFTSMLVCLQTRSGEPIRRGSTFALSECKASHFIWIVHSPPAWINSEALQEVIIFRRLLAVYSCYVMDYFIISILLMWYLFTWLVITILSKYIRLGRNGLSKRQIRSCPLIAHHGKREATTWVFYGTKLTSILLLTAIKCTAFTTSMSSKDGGFASRKNSSEEHAVWNLPIAKSQICNVQLRPGQPLSVIMSTALTLSIIPSQNIPRDNTPS